MRERLIVTAAVVSAALLLAWWGLHLAIELDALASERAFATGVVRRCPLEREAWYTSGYVERC